MNSQFTFKFFGVHKLSDILGDASVLIGSSCGKMSDKLKSLGTCLDSVDVSAFRNGLSGELFTGQVFYEKALFRGD